RNWLISRQRYWGTPIPIIYCDDCGTVPVPFEHLPVKLPKGAKFTGSGNPLETVESFVNVKCPACSGPARRETDTMDTFVDSSWYFFRFISPDCNNLPFDKKMVNYWAPVDQYIGGIEHAVMHLLYARFFTKVTRDMGLHDHDEPFNALLTQGMVNKENPFCVHCNQFLPLGKYDSEKETCMKCGKPYALKSAKMSKSLGNVVAPKEIVDTHGADTARFFILGTANPEKGLEWSDEGVSHVAKLVRRIFALVTSKPSNLKESRDFFDDLMLFHLNRYLDEITKAFDSLNIRDGVNFITQLVDHFKEYIDSGSLEDIHFDVVEKLILVLAPVVPHLAEEAWSLLGHESFVSMASWPEVDKSAITKELKDKWEFYNNIREDVLKILKILKEEPRESIKLIVAAKWKFNIFPEIIQKLKDGESPGNVIKNIMKDTSMRKHGREVAAIVNKINKDPWSFDGLLKFSTQEEETTLLKEIEMLLAKKFSLPIEIELEEESKEKKASVAYPGRPGIIIS
ncbi:class I tRNA ligase family protein, partial [Candidatus Bathyarchaeota archaeon]|nr:class I tRNA ligase family protein [Candidatus Bathyarchaeota archaeon]